MEITPKILKKLTLKKFRQELRLCILEGEKIIADNEGRIVKMFAQCEVPADILKEVKTLETYMGAIAVAEIPAATAPTSPFLVLDNIQDAGNMGTILRTAAAFGYRTIYAVNCVDPWSQKVLRAGAGLSLQLNIIECGYADLPDGVLFVADLDGAPPAGVRPPAGAYGVVLGNEGRGVSAEIYARPHTSVTIPMAAGCESLNVAVAAGILMYLLNRK